jgi:hypothetical protein
MLEKFEAKGIKVVDCYDEEKEFCVIPNHKCMYLRPENWKYANEPLLIQKKKMEKEIQIRFQAIIVAGQEENPYGLFHTLDSIYSQELKPVHVAVIRPPGCLLKPSVVVDYLKPKGIRWKVENILDFDYPKTKWEDLIVDFVKDTHMYSVFNAGTIVPPEFFSTINDKIHNEMLSFSALTPNSEGSGWTIPRSIYVYFMGNKQLSMLTKLEGHECPMYPATEVVPNFPR